MRRADHGPHTVRRGEGCGRQGSSSAASHVHPILQIPAHNIQNNKLKIQIQKQQHLKNKDPGRLFDEPDYVATGGLFWPDFWAVVEKKDLVFDMVGLDYEKASVRSLGA